MKNKQNRSITTTLQITFISLSAVLLTLGEAAANPGWNPTGSLGTERLEHTATLLPNGKVLVAGGGNFVSHGALSSAELYDPASGTWTTTGGMSTARSGHMRLTCNRHAAGVAPASSRRIIKFRGAPLRIGTGS